MELQQLKFDEDSFLQLLGKLIGETKHLQNNPPDFIPKEDRAAQHVLDVLEPHSTENGGPLQIQQIAFVEGRSNVIVQYPAADGTAADGGVVSFVGCHMDVVPANPETWSFPAFELTRDGDKLRGRGVTDCLGHVALVTEFMRQLAVYRPRLRRTVVAVFIANEEFASELGIGVDELVKRHYLDHLKLGPLYWVDTADSAPCIGTGGVAMWELKATGKLFHSGLAHKAINAIELASDALSEIQRRFYADFPPHEKEARWRFATPSTIKPTQWRVPAGSVNQIPGEATICGDIRVTPFYDIQHVMATVKGYVDDINANIASLTNPAVRGPISKYELPDEKLCGRLELTFHAGYAAGVACNLDSPGYGAMVRAFDDVFGNCQPYSITGSLPCIADLQAGGYDVQTFGFGRLAAYHAVDEHAFLSDFEKGFSVMVKLVDQ